MNCVQFDLKVFLKRLCNWHLLWEVVHVFSYRDRNVSRCLSPHSIEPLLFSVSVVSRDAICSEHLYLIQHLIDDVGGRILCTSVGKKTKKQMFKWFEVWGNYSLLPSHCQRLLRYECAFSFALWDFCRRHYFFLSLKTATI